MTAASKEPGEANREIWLAIASSPLTAATGRPQISAQPFTVVRPTRNPVKEPGPASTANKSIASREMRASSSSPQVSRRRLDEYGSSGELARCVRIVVSRNKARLPDRDVVSSARIIMVGRQFGLYGM